MHLLFQGSCPSVAYSGVSVRNRGLRFTVAWPLVNIVRRLLPKPRRLVLQMTEVGLAQQLLRVPKPFRIPRNLERRTQGNHGHRHN